MTVLRLLTRGSALALAQSRWVAERLRAAHPGLPIEIRTVKTRGDRITHVPLAEVGGKGLFVREIEEALLKGNGDIAVHSLKDMTSQLAPGLLLAAVPEREDPHDALVLRIADCGLRIGDGPDSEPHWQPGAMERHGSPANPQSAIRNPQSAIPVPEGGVVGTSSLRRRAQLRAWRPDVSVVNLRGNLDTRLRKLDDGEYHAIVLAAAGLRRLGQEARISMRLPVDRFVPAVGQGALGIEAREDDHRTRALLTALEDGPTRACVTAERAFLARLEGDCAIPLGALATCAGAEIHVTGMVADPEGREILRRAITGAASEPEALGKELAEALLAAGGARLLGR